MKLLQQRWSCSNVRPNRTIRVWWCSTTTGNTDSRHVMREKPLAYWLVCTLLCSVIYVQPYSNVSNALYVSLFTIHMISRDLKIHIVKFSSRIFWPLFWYLGYQFAFCLKPLLVRQDLCRLMTERHILWSKRLWKEHILSLKYCPLYVWKNWGKTRRYIGMSSFRAEISIQEIQRKK
jgi:hypothetical protein